MLIVRLAECFPTNSSFSPSFLPSCPVLSGAVRTSVCLHVIVLYRLFACTCHMCLQANVEPSNDMLQLYICEFASAEVPSKQESRSYLFIKNKETHKAVNSCSSLTIFYALQQNNCRRLGVQAQKGKQTKYRLPLGICKPSRPTYFCTYDLYYKFGFRFVFYFSVRSVSS